jgi:hypothetical protein
MRRTLLSGAIGGMVTTVAFAALHHLLISNIWFSILPMLAAGAVCGLCLAWSWRLTSATPSGTQWLLYNMLFVGLFVLLGAVSFLIFEPIYTIAGLVTGTQSPTALLGKAIPLSAAFGLLAGAGMALLWGRTLLKATSLILTSVALNVLLGHNAAILGMVHMSQEAVPMLAEFYGLLAAILVGNAAAFYLLERRRLFAPVAAAHGASDAASAEWQPGIAPSRPELAEHLHAD